MSRTLSEHSFPGSPKTGRGESSDSEDDHIRTDGQAGSPVRDEEGEDCEGGAKENNMVDGDLTIEKEGAAGVEPATPLSSEIGKRGSEKSPSSPLKASSKGKQHHFRKGRKSTRQDVAAEGKKSVFDADTYALCVMIPVDGCGSTYACFQINLITVNVSVGPVQRLKRRDGPISYGKTCLLSIASRTSDTRCACAFANIDASIRVFACTLSCVLACTII